MQLEVARATSIVLRTLPFMLFRALIWAGVWVCGVAALAILGFVSLLFGPWSFWIALGALLALSGFVGLGSWAWFQLVRLPGAQHMALIVEHAADGLPPAGLAQVGWAKRRIVDRFESVSAFHSYSKVVGKALRDMHRRVLGTTVPLPSPETDEGANAPARLVELSMARVEDTIFGFALMGDQDSPYARTEQGVTRYCRHGRRLLQTSVMLTLLSWAAAAGVLVVCLVVLGLIASAVPASWEVARFILFLTSIFVVAVAKWEVLDAIADTALLLRFLKTVESPTSEAEWNARLERASAAFRAIKRKAGTLTTR
ncbi:MAG TPA: hypothetical protein HPP83_09755 [Candidatus Hydrogenedentes bacterium]|nr:hypothetical protein [Candidatus Hydrogenedentota bacterium]